MFHEQYSDMPNLNTLVINEVRAEMGRSRITAVELADRSGESVFRIRRLLDGRQHVSLDDFAMLCSALNVEPAALIQNASAVAAS